jgi:hypothetical protein
VTDIGRMISQLEQQRGAIDRAISALREVEGPKPARSVPADGTDANRPKKRRMSAAARRRIGGDKKTLGRQKSSRGASVKELAHTKESYRSEESCAQKGQKGCAGSSRLAHTE